MSWRNETHTHNMEHYVTKEMWNYVICYKMVDLKRKYAKWIKEEGKKSTERYHL